MWIKKSVEDRDTTYVRLFRRTYVFNHGKYIGWYNHR